MKLSQIKGNTWVLEGLELMPLYKVDDSHCVLFDTGLQSERQELAETLDAAGLTPVGILCTHTHWDHSINNFWLRERYGCPIAMTPGEAALCANPEMVTKVYMDFPTQLFLAFFGEMVGEVNQIIQPVDGIYSFCGVDFQVIYTPGHSPDHICVVTPDGVCYLGDALMAGESLAQAKLPYHGGHMTARRSMEKLAQCQGISLSVAAHRGMTANLPGLVADNITLLDQYGQSLLELIDQPATFEQIVTAYIQKQKLYSAQVIKVLRYTRSLQAMLCYLVDTGALSLVAKGGIAYYVPTGTGSAD